MFSTSVRSALVALTLSAITASATQGLALSLTGADAVDDVSALIVAATLTNTGDEAVKLLKEPTSLLSTYATNSFGITNEAGKAPTFTGVKVKYAPEQVAKKNDPSTFTVLAPGESVSINHNLGSAYNFTLSGESAYDIVPRTTFSIVDDKGTVSSIKAVIEGSTKSFTTKVSGRLAVTKTSHLGKRANYEGCSESQQSTLVEAAAAAQKYAEESASYLSDHTESTDRYESWFGEYTDNRHSTASDHYNKMLDHPYSDYTYDCGTCNESGVYAYVYPDEPTTIYLCEVFWQTDTTGTDSRGGTLIHESSHFTIIAGTDDHVYGQQGAGELAQSNPDQALDNADNHEYFAENNPFKD